jgi:cytochrome oxidase assembly protein ShyY1
MSFLTATLGTKAALAFLIFVLVWLRLWQIERHAQEEQQTARDEAQRLRARAAARKRTTRPRQSLPPGSGSNAIREA